MIRAPLGDKARLATHLDPIECLPLQVEQGAVPPGVGRARDGREQESLVVNRTSDPTW